MVVTYQLCVRGYTASCMTDGLQHPVWYTRCYIPPRHLVASHQTDGTYTTVSKLHAHWYFKLVHMAIHVLASRPFEYRTYPSIAHSEEPEIIPLYAISLSIDIVLAMVGLVVSIASIVGTCGMKALPDVFLHLRASVLSCTRIVLYPPY